MKELSIVTVRNGNFARMKHNFLRIVAVGLGAAGALAGSVGILSAQEGSNGTALVVVRADVLNERVGSDESEPTNGERYQSLTIYADGRECGVLPLLNDDGSNLEADAEFTVGLEGQPAVCSVEGARLTYIDGLGRILLVKHYLSQGTTYEITNFAPEPPVDPSPYPQVLIPARVLDRAEANSIGQLTVLAGGTACGQISLTDKSVRNEDGDIVFFTHPFGGRVCGDPRTDELWFADPGGRLLAERFIFDLAKPMVLFDFALKTAPQPPDAGSGRTATGDPDRGVQALVLAAGALLAAAVGFVLRQRSKE